VLSCVVCGVPAHYVGGLGVRAGRWAHAEPAPHETPKLGCAGVTRSYAVCSNSANARWASAGDL
jgi:hypothetical protein